LYNLRKQLNISSVRKNPSHPQERQQALIDVKASDLAGKWGVAQVRQRLVNQGLFIKRYALALV
jgi:hypothetical protein